MQLPTPLATVARPGISHVARGDTSLCDGLGRRRLIKAGVSDVHHVPMSRPDRNLPNRGPRVAAASPEADVALRAQCRKGLAVRRTGLKILILCGFVLAGAAFFAVSAFGGAVAEPRLERSTAAAVAVGSGPLARDGFWNIIDHSAASEANPDTQLADLRASLSRLSPSQIADFERIFDETMRQSYSWDLWGAAYVANGGASDDGFEYFRCWLISKGRKVFERVVADPDSLADLLASGEGVGDLEFEDFAYVARETWAARTKRDWNEMPVVANMAYDKKPSGVPFSENPAELARRYPKLWKRFGRG